MVYEKSGMLNFFLGDLSIKYVLSTAVLGCLVIFALRWLRASEIPIINSYPGDITNRKAHAEFTSNARGLILEGVEKVRTIYPILNAIARLIRASVQWP